MNHLEQLLQRYPLISLIELRDAYDFSTLNEVGKFVESFIQKETTVDKASNHFINYKGEKSV